jgi:uncharacterized protein
MWQPRLIVLQPTPFCNIDCRYCYLHNRDDRRLMAVDVIDAIVDKLCPHMAPNAAPRVVWHAGEPTAAPLAWYEEAHDKLRRALPADAVFAIQTNAVALSDRWIEFLDRTRTMVGVSLDGPQRFHDARRKTRSGGPTWSRVVDNLRRLQVVGLRPSVITVLHPQGLTAADEYFRFYRDHDIVEVSFSVDEINGANVASSFDGARDRAAMVEFLRQLLHLALRENHPLCIRDIERMSRMLATGEAAHNEQVEPWEVVSIAANGDVTSFSPDLMEIRSTAHGNFCFGNVLRDSFDDLVHNADAARTAGDIRTGVALCEATCRYFALCGGGSPSNKMAETGSLQSSETSFCRLSVQAPADALAAYLQDQLALGRVGT